MIKKAVIFPIFFACVVANSARADQLQSFMVCANITEDIKRLACFDGASKKMPEPATGVAAVAEPQAVREKQIADFGKKQLRKSPVKEVRKAQKKEDDKGLKAIKLTVVDVAYTITKKFVLFMENGQIWKQKEDKKVRLPKGKFEVVIKKGLIGGYNMTIPSKRTFIRVKRLK
ncbi:MAG: hypothetical protein COB49_06145 [Alphaproteobacteria bacterium]|nr:MAG: hypothetical protein COB49_06145 [Alphaproteobacteria bacterium]